MKLLAVSLWFSKAHWKHTWRDFARSFLAALGVTWTVTRIALHYYPEQAAWIFGSWWAVGLPAVVCATIESWPKLYVEERLSFSDTKVQIRVGDVLAASGGVVIPTNTTFDTSISKGIIAPDSLQGQFLAKHYGSEAHLDHDLEASLQDATFSAIGDERRGKKKKYPNGTVARIEPSGHVAYFLAIADMNVHSVASSSREQVLEGLGSLWHYISERGGIEPLAVPILGTGRGRIAVPRREEMVREIIKSFIAACSEIKFCDRLAVVISAEDYREHEIDLRELELFLRHLCKYTKLNNTIETTEGSAIS